MTSKGLDFIDYFFRKEGDTYISSLCETKQEYEKKCETLLATADNELQSNYRVFKSQILDLQKISPMLKSPPDEFDFIKTVTSIFNELEVDIKEDLDIIRKYNDFMTNSTVHWKGLDIDSKSVVELGVQMMATTMSITYPMFIKIGQFLAKLTESAKSMSTKYPPNHLTKLFHSLVEINVFQMAKIGMWCIYEIAKLPDTTEESLNIHSKTIAIQAKFAKNSISWAMKAICPALLLYYMRGYPGSCEVEPARNDQKERATNTEPQEEDEFDEPEQQNQLFPQNTEIQESEPQNEIPPQSAEIEEPRKRSRKSDEPESAEEPRQHHREQSQPERDEEPRKHHQKHDHPAKTEEPRKGHKKLDQSEESPKTQEKHHHNHGKKNSTEQQPKTQADFVDYFFQKQGLTFLEALTNLKRKYEERCKETLKNVDSAVKKSARNFMAKVHDVRKVAPVTKEIEVKDFKFAEEFETVLKGLESNKLDSLKDEIAMVHKYNEYTAGLIRHWEYCIKHHKEVTAETIVDGGTQMMATTMSITYPIFLKIGEFVGKLTKTAKHMRSKHPPQHLANLFHSLVELNAIQMAAIGMSCINEIAKLPGATQESLKIHSNVMAIQAKFAKNSISWAMKAISPALILYYIRGFSGSDGSDSKGNDRKNRTRSKERPKSANNPERREDKEFKESGKRNKKRPQTANTEEPKKHNRKSDQSAKTEEPRKRHRKSDQPGKVDEPKKHHQKIDTSGKSHKKHDKDKNAMYHQPKRQHDFVDYFFQKDGERLLAVLTKIKKEYEQLCNSTLPTAGTIVKKKTRQFLSTVHEVRTVDPIKKHIEVAEFNMGEAISPVFSHLNIVMSANLSALFKYYEFTKNMIAHWNYRVKNNQELAPEAIVEIGVQMMASTMSLGYPIFIQLAEFVGNMAKNPNELKELRMKSKHRPEVIAERFHKLVEVLTIQMSAIGKSCYVTLRKLPSQDSLQVSSERLTVQTKYANNSITWAMKSLGPLLLFYFIQYESA